MKVSHKIFAKNVVAGFNQTEAYLKAFPGCRSRKAAKANGSRLIARDYIKAEIARIRRENETGLMLTHREKRETLARIIRAHSPQQRAINPNNPDLQENLMQAIKLDNEMAGHNAPKEITGEVTLGAILEDLQSTPLVNPRPVASLPIPAAGGGFGELPKHTSNRNGHSNGNGKEEEQVRPDLDVCEEDGIRAFKVRLAKEGRPLS